MELPIVEAAPQDIHDDTNSGAQPTVVQWRSLPHVRRETVGAGVEVGVIDTAVDITHPWFAGQVHGDRADDVNGLLLNNYKAGHATFVAGLVLEQAPAATVTVRGVLDAQGHAPTETVIQEALRLVQRTKADGRHEIDILNLSLGCYGSDEERAQFTQLFEALWQENPELVVVAAAGNQRPGELRPFYPAALADHSRLVSVGAAADLAATQWASFSNQGPDITFRVCGAGLVSTFLRFTTQSGNPNGRWARWAGTSFATAAISGMIAARMAPGGGLPRRTGPQAVAELFGNAARPVSLAIDPFPPAPEPDAELQQEATTGLAPTAIAS